MKVATAQSNYGAIELKRAYQSNLFKGLVIAAALHLSVMGSILLYQYITRINEADIPVITIRSIADLAPPPSVQAKPPQVQVEAPKIAPPSVGIPKPVPDEMVTEEVTIATRQELATIVNPSAVSSSGSEGAALVIDIPDEDFLPSSTEFIAVEKEPVRIKSVTPEYPELARKAGLTGTVILRILVYKDGTVKDVIVARPSGSDVGFEESAVAAAKQWVFKPAIQNQKPISVWINYPVKFTL